MLVFLWVLIWLSETNWHEFSILQEGWEIDLQEMKNCKYENNKKIKSQQTN